REHRRGLAAVEGHVPRQHGHVLHLVRCSLLENVLDSRGLELRLGPALARSRSRSCCAADLDRCQRL
ncbi:hypothetical protein BN1708_019965, partial [Verticillium longisporum]